MLFCKTMNGKDFILLKQQNWAKRKGFDLVPGTIGSDGVKVYVSRLEDNLFGGLSSQTKADLAQGSGHETRGVQGQLPHMQSLGSSSALAVNLFQYWQGKDIRSLLLAMHLIAPVHSTAVDYSLSFESKQPIGGNLGTPNIDVAIRESTGVTYAFESKFVEPYRDTPKEIQAVYLENKDFQQRLPHLYGLAKELVAGHCKFQRLDAAQLIKHALGLCNPKQAKSNFCLVYLWYDVPGKYGCEHREEIEQFAQFAKDDGIRFKHITYQKVIANLLKNFYQGNEAYCDYMAERYL